MATNTNTRRAPRSDLKPMDKRYGRWTVLDPTEHAADGKVECECTCGTVRRIRRVKLRQGESRSCGCDQGRGPRGRAWNTEALAPAHATSVYPGAQFGRWTVKTEIRPTHKRHGASCPTGCTLRNNRTVECLCECGNTGTVVVAKLLNATSRSCGCLRSDGSRIRSTH